MVDGNPGPFEDTANAKVKTEKPKVYETTPFWMVIAAIIALAICATIFCTKFTTYQSANPPELTMEMVHELVGDALTAHQWEMIDLADESDRIEITHYMGGTGYQVQVHGPFLSGQEIAEITIFYSRYNREYTLHSVEWKVGCTCGCEICEEECA